MRISDWSSDVCSSDLPRSARSSCIEETPISSVTPETLVTPHSFSKCSISEKRPSMSVSAPPFAATSACPSAMASGSRSRAKTCAPWRSEEHTSELQSLMRTSYAVFCWKKKNTIYTYQDYEYMSENKVQTRKTYAVFLSIQ